MLSDFLKLFPSKKKKSSLSNNGVDNIVEIDDDIFYQVKINGNNNVVKVRYDKNVKNKQLRNKTKILINICGHNNKIDIDELSWRNSGVLNIDIGNYTGCNNVNIDIGKNLVFVNTKILAYQNNVPVKIGDNCLFSTGIVIRTGELPHVVYDIETKRDLDKSEGVFVGDHVWLGQNVFVLKNVTIPNNTIIGSCSVVTKRFSEENTVIAGNPAKVRKRNVGWALTKEFVELS